MVYIVYDVFISCTQTSLTGIAKKLPGFEISLLEPPFHIFFTGLV